MLGQKDIKDKEVKHKGSFSGYPPSADLTPLQDQILLRKIWGRKVSTLVRSVRAACRGCQEASKNTWHILNANYNAVAEAESVIASSEAVAVA